LRSIRSVGQADYGQYLLDCNAPGGRGATKTAGETDAEYAARDVRCMEKIMAKDAEAAALGLPPGGDTNAGDSSAWDAFWGGFGTSLPGALPGIFGGSKNGTSLYSAGGFRPPAAPAEATILGMNPIVVLTGLALVIWLAMRAMKARKGKK
jgi:hypothetical protein